MTKFMIFQKKRSLYKAFVESQFKYCPLTWKFHGRKTNYKINRLHEWALKLIYNDHISSCKACACYFLSNFYFSPKDSPSKTTKKFFISSKKLFFSQDIQIFVFLPSHLFFHVSHCFRSWSKKILKVYDVINCLNKKLITHFVWYLDKEIRRDIETLSIERVVNKEHFDGKIMQKMCTKN